MTADKRNIVIPITIVCIMAVMHLDAHGLAVKSALLRLCLGLVLLSVLAYQLVICVRRREELNWLAICVGLLGGWVAIRIIVDVGIQFGPLLRATWFPVLFFLGFLGVGLSRATVNIFTGFALFSATLYLLNDIFFHISGAQEINSVYYSVFALPFVLSRRKGWAMYLAVAVILLAVLLSGKLAGIIAVVIAILLKILVDKNRWKLALPAKRTTLVALSALTVGVIVAGAIAISFNRGITDKILEALRVSGSGRTVLFSNTIDLILGLPFGSAVVGVGDNRVAEAIGKSSHNDFLEVTYNFGLIATILLAGVVVGALLLTTEAGKAGSPITGPLAASIAIFVVMANLSHVILVSTYPGMIAFFWGCASSSLIARQKSRPDSASENKILKNGAK